MERRSIFEVPGVFGFLLIVSLGVPAVVIELTKDSVPSWLGCLVGAATCLPTAFLFGGILYFIESWWRPPNASNQFGVKFWGLLYAQAAVFFYAPMVLRGEDDGAVPLSGAVVSWVAAIACTWAGFRAKERHRYRLSLSRLAETNPTLTTRFLVQTDRKSWKSVQPEIVLRYQAWFEKALFAVGEINADRRGVLTESQEKKLVAIAEDAYLHAQLWPGVIASLVFLFIQAPENVQVRDRAEWAAAVVTRTDAGELRESVEPEVKALFRKHSTRFRA